jgi:hypothetical protein
LKKEKEKSGTGLAFGPNFMSQLGPMATLPRPARPDGTPACALGAVAASTVGIVARLPVAHRPVIEEVVGGESRRGPRGMCWARQEAAWLTEKLRHQWDGGVAPGDGVLPRNGAPVDQRSISGSLQQKSKEGEVRGKSVQ